MTTFENAYQIILNEIKPLGFENVKIENALNRILASDVISDIDMPPFNKSAMDGFACRREDISNELTFIETIAAGDIPKKTVEKNQCAKIMTGAMVPDGADIVIMVEQTECINGNKIRFNGSETANNIAYKAEDIKKGDIVLKKGQALKPQHISILASVGCHNPEVVKQPCVGVISTGIELVEPTEIPMTSQIRNSNAYQLINQIKNTNAIPIYYGIAKDDEAETEVIIDKAISECDVVILTGGVSMGDFDFIPGILKKKNVNILFQKLKVKPGKPTVFGTIGSKYIFGLPGNPVSSFIMFEMLVKPLLLGVMGNNFTIPYIYMPLERDFLRKKADRILFAPVKFNKNGMLEFVEYHGSAHIHSLCDADGIVIIPIGVTKIKRGEMLHVRQI